MDGQLLTSANKQSWQKQVAHVPQSIFLTDGSIAENIALGVPEDGIDEEKLRDVCRLAELAHFWRAFLADTRRLSANGVCGVGRTDSTDWARTSAL